MADRLATILGVGGRTSSANPLNLDGSNVDVGGCDALAIAMSLACEALRADAKVQEVVGMGADTGVEIYDSRPFWDYDNLPKLQLYPSSEGETILSTSNLSEMDCRFVAGYRQNSEDVIPREPWEPGSMSFVSRWVIGALRNMKSLTFYTNDECVQVALHFLPGPAASIFDLAPDGVRVAVTQQVAVDVKVKVDRDTGLPRDLVRVLAL